VGCQLADGRDLARGNYPPCTIGSSVSPLVDKFSPTHHDVKATEHELRIINTWITSEANCTSFPA